ncbi:MAG: serine O-acetyltransferase [Alphaproteobacteria bacterium]
MSTPSDARSAQAHSLTGAAEGQPPAEPATCDPIWECIRAEAEAIAVSEPVLASFVHATVLNHDRLEGALSYHLAQKLSSADTPAMLVRQVIVQALIDDPWIGDAVRSDLAAVFDRDPACHTHVQALLFFKGFQALQAYRIAHWLWTHGRWTMALYFQNRISDQFGVDIHPAATIGQGIMMDHASGIVIGETASVGDNVSMLHGVTLGGTGKDSGDRHPKIGSGVLIGAGAKILGNIRVGNDARVAAGSVVLKSVPAQCTVAGIPGRIVGCAGCEHPSQAMDQRFPYDDDAWGDPET